VCLQSIDYLGPLDKRASWSFGKMPVNLASYAGKLRKAMIYR
jgi:hypothetical protein